MPPRAASRRPASRRQASPHDLKAADARRIWLGAQRLDAAAPFGSGPEATRLAVEHLGYVQIDTINVIERCHHHILFTRIPDYRRAHLQQAQSADKTVFEYWTHALSYVPSKDIRYFLGSMKRYDIAPSRWYQAVNKADLTRLLARIRKEGPITMRDIDDAPVEKDHPWASRKPSKRVLQLGFYTGKLTINARSGMLKSYELMDRHFGWEKRPKPATEADVAIYMLDRALRAQGFVSLDSICHLDAKRKPFVRRVIERRVQRRELVAVRIEGCDKVEHWAPPQALETPSTPIEPRVHILSPFDPLVIQRRRLKQIFGYEHRFEAYVPKDKRMLGYFALPVLVGDEIVAALDLKTDRENNRLLMQHWTWIGRGAARIHKRVIDDELVRFERFQLGA